MSFSTRERILLNKGSAVFKDDYMSLSRLYDLCQEDAKSSQSIGIYTWGLPGWVSSAVERINGLTSQSSAYVGMTVNPVQQRMANHATDRDGNRHTRQLKRNDPLKFWQRAEARVIIPMQWDAHPSLVFGPETVVIILTNNSHTSSDPPNDRGVSSSGLNVNFMDHVSYELLLTAAMIVDMYKELCAMFAQRKRPFIGGIKEPDTSLHLNHLLGEEITGGASELFFGSSHCLDTSAQAIGVLARLSEAQLANPTPSEHTGYTPFLTRLSWVLRRSVGLLCRIKLLEDPSFHNWLRIKRTEGSVTGGKGFLRGDVKR